MKINRNGDITLYRGETGAIDFKISQRTDYYVPFLISSNRVNPMVCITIGSSKRESKNIVNKQLWLELDTVPKFNQTVVSDLGPIVVTPPETLAEVLCPLMTAGIMYQFKLASEVAQGIDRLHFAYETSAGEAIVDEYEFKITLALDDEITLDMTNIEYFYQIELMDTVPMISHLQNIFSQYPELLVKLPDTFINTEGSISQHLTACINVVTKEYPKHWGYRVSNPYTSPVASVSNIQMIQPPRNLIIQSVVK